MSESLEANPEPVSELVQISELINPAEEQASPEPEEATDALQDAEEPETDKTATEETAEPEDSPPSIYDEQVKVNNGQEAETLTVGQLKDYYQEHRGLEQERETWTNTRTEQENELLVTRQQLLGIAQHLGDVKPELIQQIAQQEQARVEQQRALMLTAIPEWQDEARLKADRDAITELAIGYGLNELELNQVQDHRFVKMLRDFMQLKRQQEQARAKLEAAPKPPKKQNVTPKQSNAQSKRAKLEQAKNGTREQKLSAISELISGS